MRTPFREYLSDSLLDAGVDRAMQRQELERGIATESTATPGYETAQHAMRSARRRESVMLWLGWRLHPRHLFTR